MSESETIAVLGAGTMGQGIAQVAAQAGRPVTLYDPFADALAQAEGKLQNILARLEAKGRLDSAEEVLGRISFTDELSRVNSAGWIIEAAPENLELKRKLFEDLGRLAPGAALASNTSTFSITHLAAQTGRPQDVIGLHFFNPAPLMKLVEVIPGTQTRPELVERALALVKGFGKKPVVAKDSPGFIVNRVARPFYGEALKLYGEGVPLAAIDEVMRGLGFRMGPFELMDLIGIDVNYAATQSVYNATFQEPRFRPHPIQRRMVEAGYLGRKTERGFYSYPHEEETDPTPVAEPDEAPTAYLLGSRALVEAVKDRFSYTEDPAEADLVLDLRPRLQDKSLPGEAAELPLLTLVWGHSSSLALARYQGAGAVAGVGLLPPLTDRTVAEIYPPLSGENAASRLARRFFEAHGLRALTLPDQPGGVGFRIVAMLVNEAVSGLAEDLATAEDIDRAMCLGVNYPLGPLAWSERLGLGNVLDGLSGLFEELGEPRYRPQPLLKRAVAAGLERWSEL